MFKEHPLLPPGQALINCFAIEGGGNTFILPNECRLYLTTVYLPNEQLDDVKAQVEGSAAGNRSQRSGCETIPRLSSGTPPDSH